MKGGMNRLLRTGGPHDDRLPVLERHKALGHDAEEELARVGRAFLQQQVAARW